MGLVVDAQVAFPGPEAGGLALVREGQAACGVVLGEPAPGRQVVVDRVEVGVLVVVRGEASGEGGAGPGARGA